MEPTQNVVHPVMQQQMQTTVINMQPAIREGPYPQNVRDWSTGLCACCADMCSCMYAFCAMTCFKCTLASKMNEWYCGPWYVDKPFLIAMRTKVRTMFGIKGSICCDCLAVSCCEFCAVTQMMRELDNSSMM